MGRIDIRAVHEDKPVEMTGSEQRRITQEH